LSVAIGKWREKEEDSGLPVDPSGKMPAGGEFTTFVQFRELLAQRGDEPIALQEAPARGSPAAGKFAHDDARFDDAFEQGVMSAGIQPINTARQIAAQIVDRGYASHPYIGVRLQALTPQLAREINGATNECRLPEVNGVVVVDVMAGSPADRGGLKPCDLIERVGDQAVANPSEVQLAVDRVRVGDAMSLQVRRREQALTLTLRPAELPRKQ
jgi:S1-C subfamily serine protease